VYRKLIVSTGAAALIGVTLFGIVTAQQYPPVTNQSQQEREMQDRQMKEANKKRQQDIRADTLKLYQLATDLKAAVDKSNENMLSLDVIRKAEEVEKLAKKVKEKMRDAIGPSPRLEQGPPPVYPHPPGS
jgi:ribulose kinase